LLIVYLCRKDF